MKLPNIADIHAAAARINGRVRVTPVLTSSAIDAASGASIWFKCENLQHMGAFKFRGASNAVWALADDAAARGVLTHSSGNHGAALGLAARERGIPAHIVVPENAPAIKIANMRASDAHLHFCAPTLAAREHAAAQVQVHTGSILIHPFTHLEVIAGQGTAVLELLAAEPRLEAILVPVGGGGLLAGTAIATHAHNPGITVFAAEPEGAADAFRAMASGQLEQHPIADTICDGLRAGIGEINFQIMRREAVQVLIASDAETATAMRMIWDRLKLIVEPSAAVCLAVMLRHAEVFRGRRVGVILSGGNVDLDALPWR